MSTFHQLQAAGLRAKAERLIKQWHVQPSYIESACNTTTRDASPLVKYSSPRQDFFGGFLLQDMVPNETSKQPTQKYDTYVAKCVLGDIEYPFLTRFPSSFYVSHVVCLILNIIQTLLIISLNYLAIHAFCKSAQLKRKATLFVVMLLSTNDLAIGIIAEPLFLLLLSREIFATENCLYLLLNVTTLNILLAISMTTFLVLNFEIYLSIIHPIFHQTKISKKRVLYLLLLLWFLIVARTYFVVRHLNQKTSQFIATFLISLAMLAMVYMHTRIFAAIRKRRRFKVGASPSTPKHGKTFLSGVRDAKSCLLVLVSTVCCYLLAAIDNGIGTRSTHMGIVLSRWSTTFVLSASVLNSLVFYWRNNLLRKEAIRILRTFC